MPETPLDIDNYFPEAAERQKKAREEWNNRKEAKRTNFGHYPDVQDLCDAFLEEMGWAPNRWTIKQVAAGARDFVEVHGQNIELMLKTIRRLKREAPHVYKNIASPRSLITAARSNTGGEASRRRYVEGEFADFWDE